MNQSHRHRRGAHTGPLDESRWRCRAEANEKWPEKMDVVERTEEIEVLTVCKEGETCDVDGKYKKMLMPKTERYTVDVNANGNHEYFMGCMGGAGWIQKTLWFGRR
ncbi:hypothetical protein [Stenotrophomonas maltophilia]|uniref:hypothetical protein n=1 Tax=Stenotrophomonas maltophilia TaxID=40324 RepID=UPI00163D6650|nr:hypothetical protein [Stenotrophomonas maltophilia]